MWKEIVSDLMALGMTQEQIGSRCGCKQASISDLHLGKVKHPRYPVAQALRALHKRSLKKSQALAKEPT